MTDKRQSINELLNHQFQELGANLSDWEKRTLNSIYQQISGNLFVSLEGRKGVKKDKVTEILSTALCDALKERSEVGLVKKIQNVKEKTKKVLMHEILSNGKVNRSWMKTATFDQVKQYIKDQGWYGKGTWWMSKTEEGLQSWAGAFYRSITKVDRYKKLKKKRKVDLFWFNDGKNNDRGWMKTATFDKVKQYIIDQEWYGKGTGWIVKQKKGNTFYRMLSVISRYKDLTKEQKINLFWFDDGKNNDRGWMKTATFDQAKQYIKDQGWYGKGVGWIKEYSLGNTFYRMLSVISRYKDLTKEQKIDLFWFDNWDENRGWMKTATFDQVKQYIKDQGWYGKGVLWISVYWSGFYNKLKNFNRYELLTKEQKIDLFWFNAWYEDRNWMKTATFDQVKQYIKNQWWSGKWPGRMQTEEGEKLWANKFYSKLVTFNRYSKLNKEQKIDLFWFDNWYEDRSWMKTATFKEIKQYIKKQWWYEKGAWWIGAQELGNSFCGRLFILPRYIILTKEQKIDLFWFDDGKNHDWGWMKTATFDQVKQYIVDQWWYGKGTGWIIEYSLGNTFYGKLSILPRYNKLTKEQKIDLFWFDSWYENWNRMNTATFNEVKQYIKDQWWYGKGFNWIAEKRWWFNQKLIRLKRYKKLTKEQKIDLFWKTKISYMIKWEICYFDSYPERKIAVIFNKLWIVPQWKEWENLHVYTNGQRKHSIDFKIGNLFFEYHPVHRSKEKKWWSFENDAKGKNDNITNPLYRHIDLHVFDLRGSKFNEKKWTFIEYKNWFLLELYHLIKNIPQLIQRIPLDKRYIMLSEDNFKVFYNQVVNELVNYDTKSKNDKELPDYQKAA